MLLLPAASQRRHALPYFQGRERQERYLRDFSRFDEDTRQALEGIYAQAQDRKHGIGRHVITTMVEVGKHPKLLPTALMNILQRVAGKVWAKLDRAKSAKLAEVLEDFHIALDAFFRNLPLDEAVRLRKERNSKPWADISKTTLRPMTAEERAAVAHFKELTGPTVRKASNLLRDKTRDANSSSD